MTNKQRGDGESIISEGGGPIRTENTGYVVIATVNSLTDPNLLAKDSRLPTGQLPDNFGVAIVGGAGAGQTRRIVAINGSTLTVDHPWLQVPDATSRYATFIWGLEKAIIKDNIFKAQQKGIWLYQTSMQDVDVVGNKMLEGGGIFLRSAQNLKNKLFTPMYRIRIADNSVINTEAQWRSYIAIMFVRMDVEDFGVGTTGIEVRNNRLVANTPNLSQPSEDSGGIEGYTNFMRAEDSGNAQSKYQARLLGTIFQNNRCEGCEVGILVRDGAQATVQDGNEFRAPKTP
jgi:hypothetical protein